MMRTFRVTLDLWDDPMIHHFNCAARSHEEAYNRVLEEKKIPDGRVRLAYVKPLEIEEKGKC